MQTQKGYRGIAKLILNLSAGWGVDGQHHAPATLPTGTSPGTHCTGCWMGVKTRKSLAPTEVQNPKCPAHSKLLYWLCCPGLKALTARKNRAIALLCISSKRSVLQTPYITQWDFFYEVLSNRKYFTPVHDNDTLCWQTMHPHSWYDYRGMRIHGRNLKISWISCVLLIVNISKFCTHRNYLKYSSAKKFIPLLYIYINI